MVWPLRITLPTLPYKDAEMRFFVTGTDTNVGKTVISAALTLGLQGHYWKPIQTGKDSDSEWVKQKIGFSESHFIPEAYRLINPLSPHAAAELDGISIELDKIQLPKKSPLIVEGAGGVMVPLNANDLMIDLIEKFFLKTIVVARSTLGTINHTLMTLDQLRRKKVPIQGVVLNGPKNEGNKKAIAYYGQVKILGEVEIAEKLDRSDLLNIFNSLTIR